MHMTEPPLKICFPFNGNTLGGSHLSALLLAIGLDRGAFDPLVLVHRDGPLTDHLRQQRIPFRRVPESWILEYSARTAVRDGLWLLPASLAMKRFLSAERVDLVHVNDNRMGTTWSPAARLAGCRLVWHQRTRPVLSRRMRFFAGLADHIVCISQYCSESFRGPRFADRLSVVHNPFHLPAGLPDKPAARARLQTELGVPPETILVTFAANILPHKRPLVFVEAARIIAAKSPRPVAFPIFGRAEGPLYERMRQRIAELGLAENFHFLGFRSPIEPWIRGSDLLLSPSIEEGYGRTLVEAMLMETPVVAAASGGYREVVSNGTTGILVEPDNAAGFAEAALAVLENPAYAASLTRAARDFADRLDIETHVRQVTTIYRRLGAARREEQ
ncbi:MAG: glycosyltransferase [Kiloniellaceae bacterium]